jgi:hypothetical protein
LPIDPIPRISDPVSRSATCNGKVRSFGAEVRRPTSSGCAAQSAGPGTPNADCHAEVNDTTAHEPPLARNRRTLPKIRAQHATWDRVSPQWYATSALPRSLITSLFRNPQLSTPPAEFLQLSMKSRIRPFGIGRRSEPTDRLSNALRNHRLSNAHPCFAAGARIAYQLEAVPPVRHPK